MRKRNYRHFRFGHKEDYHKEIISLTNMPLEARNIKEIVQYEVFLMPSSQEYRDGLLAQLQRDGWVVIQKEDISCSEQP